MRQKRKQILTITGLLLALGTLGLPMAPARAESLVQSVVTDPLTGVALDGFDPVSYFIGASPVMGVPDYTYTWAGVPWYFASAANRDVFMLHPEIYAPQYGGHCTTALARGYLSDGNPQLYVVEGMKLYLFYSIANRDAFFEADAASVKTASANWARMQNSIAGPQAPITPTVASAD